LERRERVEEILGLDEVVAEVDDGMEIVEYPFH
jgi:hypothetical protein